jgi:hypothetical protein
MGSVLIGKLFWGTRVSSIPPLEPIKIISRLGCRFFKALAIAMPGKI